MKTALERETLTTRIFGLGGREAADPSDPLGQRPDKEWEYNPFEDEGFGEGYYDY